MRFAKIIILSTLLSMAVLCFPDGTPYAVVVNNANPDREINIKDAQKIFLGEKSAWADGSQIKVAALNAGDTHGEFVREILKMTPMQFSIHWKQKVFTGMGTGTDIKFFKSDDKVKEYIAANPGAIGYISSKSMDDTVKQLTIKEL